MLKIAAFALAAGMVALGIDAGYAALEQAASELAAVLEVVNG